ncbi:MAG: aldo/keto reductase [Alphaproteobacteria bacterium]|nr:aldo/keto reductase [Alphaproteobacteria bacterium]
MILHEASPEKKIVVLGTALWGWGVERSTAFEMLDEYAAAGGRLIDTATNYPINKNADSFKLAAMWLSEWMRANSGTGVKVFVKIGSTNNLGGTKALLTPSFIDLSAELWEGQFGDALGGLAIHWDNRSNRDDIAATLESFRGLLRQGLEIGFSGVQWPDIYASEGQDLLESWWIQVKDNPRTHTAREFYTKCFPDARYLAYGINMGGVKLDESPGIDSSLTLRQISEPREIVERIKGFINSSHTLRPAPKSLNDFSLATCFFDPNLSGIIIGPRNTGQLKSSLEYWNNLAAQAAPEMAQQIASVVAANE